MSSSAAAAAAVLAPSADDEEERMRQRREEQEKAGPLSKGPNTFTFYDVFFWRDAPDWYRKTFQSAGFGLCYCVLKQYLNRHELEVFMPPRSKILPQTMQDGYRNSQMLKYGFLKVGGEVTTIAGAAATYYAGAYYLGRYRGAHSWDNFAASGAVAGAGVALWLIRPLKARPVAFGVLLGGLLGGGAASLQQAAGLPFWDETHDFEGWFLGSPINLKKAAEENAAAAALAAAAITLEEAEARPAASVAGMQAEAVAAGLAAAATGGSASTRDAPGQQAGSPGQGASGKAQQAWRWWPLGRQAGGAGASPQQ